MTEPSLPEPDDYRALDDSALIAAMHATPDENPGPPHEAETGQDGDDA